MKEEFSGVEKHLDKLSECLGRLEPLKERKLEDFLSNADLRDIAERNLEVAAQCCIDIAGRVISLEQAEKPKDYYEAIIRIGEIGVLPMRFAERFAPIAGFRNILVHNYLEIDWKEVYDNLQKLSDIYEFMEYIKIWLRKRSGE